MFHKCFCCCTAAFQFKGYDTTATLRQIFLCQFIVFVSRKSAVCYAHYLWMVCQKFCHSLSVFHMTRHTHMQGFQTKIQIKCMLRRLDASQVTHQLCRTFCDKRSSLSEFFCISNSMIRFIRCAKSREFVRMCHPVKITGIYDGSTYCGTVSVHIFCRGMGYDICPPFKRITVYRCRERIIHDQRHSMCMCCFCKFFDIQNCQCRVCNSLAKYNSCIIPECCIQFFFCAVRCYECRCNSHFFHCHFNQIERSSINSGRRYNMAATLAHIK